MELLRGCSHRRPPGRASPAPGGVALLLNLFAAAASCTCKGAAASCESERATPACAAPLYKWRRGAHAAPLAHLSFSKLPRRDAPAHKVRRSSAQGAGRGPLAGRPHEPAQNATKTLEGAQNVALSGDFLGDREDPKMDERAPTERWHFLAPRAYLSHWLGAPRRQKPSQIRIRNNLVTHLYRLK